MIGTIDVAERMAQVSQGHGNLATLLETSCRALGKQRTGNFLEIFEGEDDPGKAIRKGFAAFKKRMPAAEGTFDRYVAHTLKVL